MNWRVFPSVVLTETDFIKYNGTYGGHIQGSADATFMQSNVSVEGKESSKLQMSFGSLRKDEVDVRRLLQDSKNRFDSPNVSSF